MTLPPLHIIILAGGQGRRIGGHKPDRLLSGRALIAHALCRLAPQGRVMLSGDSDLASRLSLPLIADDIVQSGPLGGIVSALRWAESEGLEAIVSTPCDAPFVPDDLVARLVGASEPLAIAASNGRLHPTFARWPVTLKDALTTYMQQGGHAMQGFIGQHAHSVVTWPADPYDPFFNVNTPFDLAVAEIIAAHGAAPVMLDVEGLKCPLPALKTARALDSLAAGEALIVTATDPLAILDIPHLVAQRGDTVVAQAQEKRSLRFLITRARPPE